MKANEESQRRQLWKTMHEVVLVDFQKINRLFLRFNRLFLSEINKNNLKQIYVRSGKRESHKQIYTSSLLHQELHPVPRNQ